MPLRYADKTLLIARNVIHFEVNWYVNDDNMDSACDMGSFIIILPFRFEIDLYFFAFAAISIIEGFPYVIRKQLWIDSACNIGNFMIVAFLLLFFAKKFIFIFHIYYEFDI